MPLTAATGTWDTTDQFFTTEGAPADFAFAIRFPDGKTTIVARDAQTQHLTACLKVYGGTGSTKIGGVPVVVGRACRPAGFTEANCKPTVPDPEVTKALQRMQEAANAIEQSKTAAELAEIEVQRRAAFREAIANFFDDEHTMAGQRTIEAGLATDIARFFRAA